MFATFALVAFAVLLAAAVWMGGLNQDEGWYVYAATLVGDGKMPYRDFAFTQGPVMPIVYSAFAFAWAKGGVLGARLLTAAIGCLGLFFAMALAGRLADDGRRRFAALTAFFLLGCNLYHLYYTVIPKTYALAGLFVLTGFFLASFIVRPAAGVRLASFLDAACPLGSGLSLAFAAGTRVSLGALLMALGVWLLATRRWRQLAWFCVGGFGGLALVYGPFFADAGARAGFFAAQAYHAARGGFDPTFAVGSLSRLVRWYLPVFLLAGLGACSLVRQFPFWGFLAVFAVQICAPFPYEDYQVPVVGLLAVAVAVAYSGRKGATMLPVLGLAYACAFGSPLLEKWTTNGQDRFWTRKKSSFELAQLREVARRIEALDPGGGKILTQDTYLAVETGRRVPEGLEMGPFAMLSEARWNEILLEAECPVAALSGYSFAISPPVCDETPFERQLDRWSLLKRHYDLAFKEEDFGQNATTLLVLKRKP